MTNNPFLDHLDRHYDLEELSPRDLAALAIAHELREANSLTEAINAPSRFVLGTQDPISPEDLGAEMAKTKIRAVPDDSGDARIAEAARRWAEAYGSRNMPGKAAAHHLASSELLEAVRQEDER